MDLQLAFDDEDLNNYKRSSEGDRHVPYNVKICTPQWFEFEDSAPDTSDTSRPTDPEEPHHTLKFSGDFHYGKKQFAKASKQYEGVLDVLPESNVSVRQDVRESLSRCYMYCGRQQDSLDIAKQLVDEFSSEDVARQRQSLILYSSMCEVAGRWTECSEALEKLCCLQPYYDKFWRQLGHAYVQLWSDPACSPSVMSEAKCTKREYLVLALTCFVKARLLLQSSMFRASDLITERNKELINQTREAMSQLPLPEDQKDFAYQCLRRDSDAETMDSQNEDGPPQEIAKNSPADVSSKNSPADVSSKNFPDVPMKNSANVSCKNSADVSSKNTPRDVSSKNSPADVSSSKLFYAQFCCWMEQYHQQLQQPNL